ncbi:MAG: hypothetical protein WB499_19050 [Pseudolabrys sp.]|jgi:hypothetical protein
MRRRSVVSDQLVGVVVATALFVLLPAFMIAGAFDCISANPGLHCAIVQFAFDDAPSSGVLPLRRAQAQ